MAIGTYLSLYISQMNYVVCLVLSSLVAKVLSPVRFPAQGMLERITAGNWERQKGDKDLSGNRLQDQSG